MGSKKSDDLNCLIEAITIREEILKNNQSIRKYNKYFEIMRKCARKLINLNRQEDILPYLNSNSVSMQYDIAQILYNIYPEECKAVLKRISEMSSKTGLPAYLGNVRLSALMTLEYGIPKDFP